MQFVARELRDFIGHIALVHLGLVKKKKKGPKSGAPSRLHCHDNLNTQMASEKNSACQGELGADQTGGWFGTAHQKEEAFLVLELPTVHRDS